MESKINTLGTLWSPKTILTVHLSDFYFDWQYCKGAEKVINYLKFISNSVLFSRPNWSQNDPFGDSSFWEVVFLKMNLFLPGLMIEAPRPTSGLPSSSAVGENSAESGTAQLVGQPSFVVLVLNSGFGSKWFCRIQKKLFKFYDSDTDDNFFCLSCELWIDQ